MRKILAIFLAAAMIVSTTSPVYASDAETRDSGPGISGMSGLNGIAGLAGDTTEAGGDSSVTLEVTGDGSGGGGEGGGGADPDIISATIPSVIPIKIDKDGVVTTPDNIVIGNNIATKGIKVESISLTLDGGWTAAEFSDDYSAKADDAKELGFKMRNNTLKADGTFPITETEWHIAKGTSLPLNVLAKLPKQTVEGVKGQIATVHFTLGWSGDDTSTENPPIVPPVTNKYTVTYSTDGNGTVTSNSTKEFSEGDTISFPEITPTAGYVFSKWVIGDTNTEVTSSYIVSEAVTVKAVFTKDTPTVLTVAFEANEFGTLTGNTSIQVEKGQKATFPTPVPKNPQYAFIQWVNALTNKAITPADAITDNMTIRAVFEVRASDPTTWFTSDTAGNFAGFTQVYKDLPLAPTDIVIPPQIGGVNIIGIGAKAFEGRSALTSIVMPSTVTKIGNSAFKGCTNLEYVNIPDTVTIIEDLAFAECKSLDTLVIPTNMSTLPAGVFTDAVVQNLSTYTSLTLAKSSLVGANIRNWDVKGKGAANLTFKGSTTGTDTCAIGTLTIEEASSFKVVCDYMKPTIEKMICKEDVQGYPATLATSAALSIEELHCYSPQIPYSNTTKLHPGIKKLFLYSYTGDISSAPWGAASYEWVSTPADANGFVIKGNKLMGYTGSSLDVVIPDTVTAIGANTFKGKPITSVVIPNSVTEIGDRAFSETSITTIKIPNSVTTLGTSVFDTCSLLTSAELPNSVTTLGTSIFANCRLLVSANLPNNIETIPDSMFRYCYALTGIEIPTSVTSISYQAFDGCQSFTEIDIPNSVKSIGGNAFSGCKKLQNVKLPDELETLGNSAFFGCDAFTEFTLPPKINSVPGNIVFSCDKLAKITLHEGVTSIGGGAFGGTAIESITLPTTVTSVYGGIFDSCKNLKSVTLPDGIQSIPDDMFDSCIDLSSIVIPPSVTSIGKDAFFKCSSLTSITLPSGVKTIGNNAFYNCTALVSVNVPSGVTAVGDYAFYLCSKLSSLTIPNTVKTIGTGAFMSVTAPVRVNRPNGAVTGAPWGYTGTITYGS